jgi:hypothetical protein
MVSTPPDTNPAAMAGASPRIRLLANNSGKRRTQIIYVVWFLLTVPLQGLVVLHLRYDRPNDPALVEQAMVMAAGTLLLPLIFRAPEDRGRPLTPKP